MASTCIYEHAAATIIPALISELPYSTTLLRRIQHGIGYPHETAHILATFPPGSTPEPGQPWLAARVDLFAGRTTQMFIYSSLEAEHTSIPPIATVGDSLKATKSEILNVDSGSNNNRTKNGNHFGVDPDINTTKSIVSTFSANPPVLALARAQLLDLLSYVKTNLLPPYLSYLAQATSAETDSPPVSTSPVTPNTTTNNSSSVPLIAAPDPHAFLIGALHTGLFCLLQRSGSYTLSDPIPCIRVHRFDDPPYYKYFFRRSEFSPDADSGRSADLPCADLSLPSGYRFHDRQGREGVLSKHLDLVQSRTHIPRPRTQLSTMPGMAVYFDGPSDADADEMPIAWGFLGVDGALATLHVEPEHRGRGLAATLSKAVMRRGMSVDGLFGAGSLNLEDSQTRECVGAWAHTDVAGYNSASRRVMEKIGGQVLTTVTWTVIELLD